MRLWSLHPRHLDAKGLVALWREGLLAQKVIAGTTRGYKHHPQLQRFRAHPQSLAAIGSYLACVQQEATRRKYSFDAKRIHASRTRTKLFVTKGQLEFEWAHLGKKLEKRDPIAYLKWKTQKPRANAIFKVKNGKVESWEKIENPD